MKVNKEQVCQQLNKSLTQLDEVVFFIVEKINKLKSKFLLLDGQIGAGKTTLVKALGKFWKENKPISSPTFNKMQIYDHFVHVDAYNLDLHKFSTLMDYFDDKLVIIEWAQNLHYEFEAALKIEINWIDFESRHYLICWTQT